MCIAIYSPANAPRLSKSEFFTASRNNPDGMGMACVADGTLTRHRFAESNKENTKQLWRLYVAAHDARRADCVLHFRIATHGAQTMDNTHPFLLTMARHLTLAVVHNGILDCPSTKAVSDSRWFVEYLLGSFHGRDWIENQELLMTLEHMIGRGNKMILLDSQARVSILNEKAGHWENGRWFSNNSHRPTYQSVGAYFPKWRGPWRDADRDLDEYAHWDHLANKATDKTAVQSAMQFYDKQAAKAARALPAKVVQPAVVKASPTVKVEESPYRDITSMRPGTVGWLYWTADRQNGMDVTMTALWCDDCRPSHSDGDHYEFRAMSPAYTDHRVCDHCNRPFKAGYRTWRTREDVLLQRHEDLDKARTIQAVRAIAADAATTTTTKEPTNV